MSPRRLGDALPAVLEEIAADRAASEQLRALGLEPAKLASEIEFEPASSGIDAATAGVIVALAPALNHVATSIWDEIVLPWLRRRLGSDVLGEELSRE